jgi:hypothetical protein
MVILGLYIFLFKPKFIIYPDPRSPGAILIFFGVSFLISNLLFQKLKLFRNYSQNILYFFQILIAVALFCSTMGFLGLFQRFNNYDSFVHFLDPLIFTFLLIIILVARPGDRKISFSPILLSVVLMFCLVLFWEVFVPQKADFLVSLTIAFLLFIIFLACQKNQKFHFSFILFSAILMFSLVLFWEVFEYEKDRMVHESIWLTNGDPADFRDDVWADALGIGLGAFLSVIYMPTVLKKFKNNKNNND